MQESDDRALRYRRPAEGWADALPVGDGRLGATVEGRAGEERLVINEESLWAGGPIDRVNPDARDALDAVRESLFAGDYHEAEAEISDSLTGDPPGLRPYQLAGELRIDFADGDAYDYRRELNLNEGVVTVSYDADGSVTRETFAARGADVLVQRIEGAPDFSLSLDRPDAESAVLPDERELVVRGALVDTPTDWEGEGGWGQRYEVRASLRTDGEVSAEDGALSVSDAEETTVLVAARTGVDGDPTEAVTEDLAAAPDYGTLRAEHAAAHRERFERVAIDLGERVEKPTDERLAAVADGERDPDLLATHFQYGRYLLLGSAGRLPPNLQGLWVEGTEPAWGSDYHLNINLQMNYWPAEATNLPETVEPLHELLDSLREPGREIAREQYGCDGFVVHHATDIWGTAAPGGSPWGVWPMGAAWLCRHLWERYEFSRDAEQLAAAYPIFREACEFFLDFLVEDPETGELVTNPSYSPENAFLVDGEEAHFSVGATMDVAILRDLFAFTAEAADLLGRDEQFRRELLDARGELPFYDVEDDGTLAEWRHDYPAADPGHRHISHLYGFHPGDELTPERTPDLAEAARATLEARVENGGANTGWSRAWFASQYARLKDGERVAHHLRELLARFTRSNLYDTHPPDIFQIDGNFGASAAVAEALLASHADGIEPLPALPPEWDAGSVEGLRARGGFEVRIEWEDERAQRVWVRSTAGRELRLRAPDLELVSVNGTNPNREVARRSGTLVVDTAEGETLVFERLS